MTVATDTVLPLALTLVRQYLLDTILAPDNRVFWGLGGAPKDVPRIIVQPSGPGVSIRYVGMPAGWQGEIAVRAYALSLEAAESLLVESLVNLPNGAIVTDSDGNSWSIQIRSIRPIPSLPGPTIAVCGIAYSVRVTAL